MDRKSSDKICRLKNEDNPKKQNELVNMYGIARTTMNNYMRLAKAISELEELVDIGEITKTFASATIASLLLSIHKCMV